ncbi:hypothetical protein NUW58_g552 [Xylaria curta]|uniref:Uncharacterized protein n=1 Tax=Xylaria curta TaxID=42375 RepID=A0ACC1PNT8_9PEZI|nr:hypothetical protein NUW58_g552 [Xylaria curta]
MKFSARVLLAFCLSGALADLPYRDFEGRDVHIDAPVPSRSTIFQATEPQYPTGTGSGGYSPTDTQTQTSDSKFKFRYISYNSTRPTAHPTGGHPYPGRPHGPNVLLETPPYPTSTQPFSGDSEGAVYTMRTVTRTRGPSEEFPHGTGSPYPYGLGSR